MTDMQKPYLCGGTFFFLLLQARYSKTTSSRNHVNGEKEDKADRYVMDKLVYAVTGNNSYNINSTFKKDTSKYRECQIAGSVNIPFNDPAVAASYFMAIKNKNLEILKRMTEFVDTYINPTMDVWLVRALLEVIQADDISNEINFYISSDGTPLKKKDLFTIDSFELQPFLMGILLFIMQYRTDNAGSATLANWGTKKSSNQERKFTNATLGTQYSKTIKVSRIKPLLTDDIEDFKPENMTEDSNETEYIEAEVVDDDTPFGAASKDAKDTEQQSITVIQHQTNVIQNGDKSVSLVNNGNLTINL